MSHVSRRLGALVAASALAVTGITQLGSPAGAVPVDPRPVTIGTDWLEGQLTGGLIHNDQYDIDDIGLTIDAGLSLEQVGDTAAVSTIAAALAPKIAGSSGYISSDEYDWATNDFLQTGYYANATAKALVFAQATGQNTSTWAGVDLVAALESRVITTGPSTGRIADDSSYGDYGNSIGQAYAARALTQASSPEAADVTAFLLDQQCDAGFFRLGFTDPKDAADQTCQGAVGTDASAPDTDVTALAVLQLKQIAAPTQAVSDAIAHAGAWLLGAQHADGSFGGGASTEAPNSNSTGLAAWALGVLDDTAAAGRAAVWLRMHQADELTGCPSALSTQTGAVAYDDDALAAGRTNGITTQTQDQWRRTTAPILPALAFVPTAEASLALDGPTDFVKAGSTVPFAVSGVAPGDTVCVSAFGAHRPAAAGADGRVTLAIEVPGGTAVRTVAVHDRSGSAAVVQFTALGAKTLRVAAPARAGRGHRVKVTVRGLRPAERVVLTYKGSRIRRGFANTHGVYVAAFRVGRALGKKKIRAFGQFGAIRKGADVVKVVR